MGTVEKKVCRILTQDQIIMGYLEIRSHACNQHAKTSWHSCRSWVSVQDKSTPSMSTTTVLMKKPSFLHTGMRIPLVVTTISVRWDSKSSTTTTIGQYTTIGLTREADRYVQRARGSSA